MLNVLVNKQTRHNLERPLEENHDASAENERQIGTTPLIKMSIDTSDHLPIAKKPYALVLKHYDILSHPNIDFIDTLLNPSSAVTFRVWYTGLK